MVDLMRRVRASYDRLADVLILFPKTEAEWNALSGDQMVALITSWWPRWVEFSRRAGLSRLREMTFCFLSSTRR